MKVKFGLWEGAVNSVDTILADIKKAGRGWQFKTKEQVGVQRQQWIKMLAETIHKQQEFYKSFADVETEE